MDSCTYINITDTSFVSNYTLIVNSKITELEKEIKDYKHILNIIANYQKEIERLKNKINFYEKAMEKCGKLNELRAVQENIELRNRIIEIQDKINEDKKQKDKESNDKENGIVEMINSNVIKSLINDSPKNTVETFTETRDGIKTLKVDGLHSM